MLCEPTLGCAKCFKSRMPAFPYPIVGSHSEVHLMDKVGHLLVLWDRHFLTYVNKHLGHMKSTKPAFQAVFEEGEGREEEGQMKACTCCQGSVKHIAPCLTEYTARST